MIDSHCHLNYPDFNHDRDAMLQRAADAGVTAFVTVAVGPEDWPRCLDLAEGRPAVRVALGIHPCEADVYTPQVAADLKALAQKHSRVVAIGETGLDFFRDTAARDKQYAAFEAQLQIAAELQKPFILHCRNAEAELLKVLEDHRQQSGAPLHGVWHCFTSTPDIAARAAALGLYFGLGGVVTYPKAQSVRDALATIPLDRILLETDCPFLAPQPWRGKRNEPAYLTAVADTIAQTRGISAAEVNRATDENARRLFGLNQAT